MPVECVFESGVITRTILRNALDEHSCSGSFECAVLNSLPSSIFYTSRKQLEDRIEAEVVFGRLQREGDSYSITDKGMRFLRVLDDE